MNQGKEIQNIVKYGDFEKYIVTTHSFLFNDDLDCTEKIIFQVLMSFADENGQCFPSFKKIAKLIKVSEKTVERKIGNMINAGYITKKARYNDKGRTSNEYTLYQKAQKKVLANNHEDKDKEQNTKNNSIAFDSNSENNKCQEEVDTKKKDFEKVREIVKEPLKDTEIKTILKVANNDFEVIKANYALTKGQDIEKMGAWLVYAIKHKLADQQEPIKNPQEAHKRPNKPSNEYKPVNTTTPPFKASKNKFNEFPQRNYTKEEFLTMEQRLLNRE